jgi:hypothetical protein
MNAVTTKVRAACPLVGHHRIDAAPIFDERLSILAVASNR